ADQYPRVIESVRGEGLMLGLKCRVPNTDLVAALREEKMLTVGAGDNVVRLLPPLNIEEAHLDEAMEKLGRACAGLDAALDEKTAAAGVKS
ncbi:MAG: acetylornithine transaminase, partial [Alphaproteobacteria bacterium HGW-Alphaproteobacteria-12]